MEIVVKFKDNLSKDEMELVLTAIIMVKGVDTIIVSQKRFEEILDNILNSMRGDHLLVPCIDKFMCKMKEEFEIWKKN